MKLNGNHFNIEALECMGAYFINKNSFDLKILSLANNPEIGDEGCKIIADMIYERHKIILENTLHDSQLNQLPFLCLDLSDI